MSDNLTKKLQKQLEARGTIASLTQINRALETLSEENENSLDYGSLFNPSVIAEEEPQSPPQQQNRFEEFLSVAEQAGITEKQDSSSVLNAVGAGLWTFADTAAFGIPGALTEEEEFIDFDDPLAKWTSAIGGFAGYVGGGPMKLGTKILQQASKLAIKNTGKQHVDEVIKGMALKGREKMLPESTIKEVTGGYKALVHKAQTNINIRGPEFKRRAEDYLDAYVQRGISTGAINAREANNIKSMFSDNVFNRPLQDFFGIIAERGILANSPRAQRVLSHAINDAVMFGLIDTGFEAISVIEDGEFDWTHPVWGLATGVAFSQLAWLKPKGNAASWKKDFMQGLKGAFGRKDIYKKLTNEQLDATGRFFGEMKIKSRPIDLNTGDPVDKSPYQFADITYKGKTHRGVKLNYNDGIFNQIQPTFKQDSREALISYLEKRKKEAGKELISYANKEALENLVEVWPRMIYGGVLFNLHSFSEMAFNEAEMGVNELLPHFLIGAWIQRHSNPSKFDMNSKSINQLRLNLMTLGMGPGQLSGIPTFNQKKSSLESPFIDSKISTVLDKAIDLNIISDSPEIANSKIAKGESSVKLPDNVNQKFEFVYEEMNQYRDQKHIRAISEISVKEANQIMESLYKTEPSLRDGTLEDLQNYFDKSRLSATKDFESRFLDVVENVRSADGENFELGITEYQDSNKIGHTPERIGIQDQLIKRAINGEFDWIQKDGVKLEGNDAVNELRSMVASFNSVLTTTHAIGLKDITPKVDNKTMNVKSSELLERLYKIVNDAEQSIRNEFPENRYLTDQFSFHDSFGDYIELLGRNSALRNAESVAEIFRPGYSDQNKVAGRLMDLDILTTSKDLGESVLRRDLRNIEFKEDTFAIDEKDPNKINIADARRFLNRILTIQSVAGGYKVHTENNEPSSRKQITSNDIISFQEFLSERGFKVKASMQKDWMHNQIVDYILKDRILKTNLKLEDTDILFNLSEIQMVSFEASVEGKASGFSIKKIDINKSNFGNNDLLKSDALEYNKMVDKMESDGKGLVNVEIDPVIILEPNLLRAITDKSVSSASKADSVVGLTKFLNVLQSSDLPTSAFKKQIEDFITEGFGIETLMRWLTAAKVVSKPPKTPRGQWTIAIDKLTDTKIEDISKRMEMFGVTQKNAETKYQESEQRVRDMLRRPVDETDTSSKLSIQDFWKKYRSENVDLSNASSAEMSESFQNLIYQNADGNVLNESVFKQVYNKMYVKDASGEFVKLNVSPSERKSLIDKGEKVIDVKTSKKLRSEWYDDFVSLLTKQQAQMPIDVLNYTHGKVSIDKDVVQTSRLDKLYKSFDLKPISINQKAPLYVGIEGRGIVKRNIDIFGDSSNLDKRTVDLVKDIQSEFIRVLNQTKVLEGTILPEGLSVFQIGKGIDAIAVDTTTLPSLHKHWKDFVKKYKDDDRIDSLHRKEMERIETKIDKIEEGDMSEPMIVDEYEYILKRLVHREMLVGKEGDQFFIDYIQGKNTNKTSGRIKLFHTKKFVRPDKNYINEVAKGNYLIGRRTIAETLNKFIEKDGFNVAIWNDEGYNTVEAEVRDQVKKLGIADKDWDYNSMIGNAHKGVSAFDSISFVSRDLLTYAHAIQGHNPLSSNPVKPVISSGGDNAPLLLGKTLFVHAKSLDGFFKTNPGLDILLSKSGAKAFNSKIKNNSDISLINREWSYIVGTKERRPIGPNKIRTIPLDALGIMPSADKNFVLAPLGMSDYNYANNAESANLYREMYQQPFERNLANMVDVAKEPLNMRQFIIDELGDDGISPNLSANQGLNHINNLVYFSSLTKDANPMSYSPNMTKNKMYSRFINSLINNNKSSLNTFDPDNSSRYGGQSILIQSPDMKNRLNSTLVNKKGDMIQRGEILLGHHEQFVSLSDLSSKGFEVRFVGGEGNKDIFNIRQVAEEFVNLVGTQKQRSEKNLETNIKITIEAMENGSLGNLYGIIEGLNSSYGTNYQVGIIVNRKPRTRPNDLAIMGLKGFLDKTYGNSIQLGSLDVVNVFEGDYDVDKADYFFSHKPSMYDHVQRTSNFFVQGIDPSDLMSKREFNFKGKSTEERREWWKMIADSESFTNNVGLVQKVPRALGYLEKLGVRTQNLNDPFLMGEDYGLIKDIKKVENGVESVEKSSPKLLLGKEGDDFRIYVDYESLDYFNRSALETQYILDGDGKLNPDISDNMISWRDKFLFPDMDKSISSDKAKKDYGVGFINSMRKNGSGPKKERVKIFRKIIKTNEGVFKEVNLSTLDKTIIKEMLNQYNQFLNSTGKSMFQNSGESRSPSYDDVLTASKKYKDFNSNISDNIYYNIRNKINPDTGKKFRNETNEEFKNFFGVKSFNFENYSGKTISYEAPTKRIIEDDVNTRAQEISQGIRGSVIDRMSVKMAIEDPFNITQSKGMTGDIVDMMDRWFNQLEYGSLSDVTKISEKFERDFLDGSYKHNQVVKTITSLKKKYVQIGNNMNISFPQRKARQEKINKIIERFELQLSENLLGKYKDTRRAKDLQKFRYVSVEKDDLKEGAIQYATIDRIQEMVPGRLKPDGYKDLKEIRSLRKLFYSNMTNLGDVIKYFDNNKQATQAYDRDTIKFLRDMPTMSTFHDIQYELLKTALSKHGNAFIFEFMKPVQNKFDIALFEGRPHTVPYKASTTYKTGLQFLTKLNVETKKAENYEAHNQLESALKYIQTLEAQYHRFFNRKIDMVNMVNENIGTDIPSVNLLRPLQFSDVRLPNFDKDVENGLTGYSRIKWTRDRNRISGGFNLMNDHLIDFYTNIAKLSGNEDKFTEYLDTMNDINAQITGNGIVDPIKHLHDRSKIDKTMKELATTTLTNFDTMSKNNIYVENIKKNPIYALMGGGDYFKGVTFERKSPMNINRLRESQRMFNNMNRYKNNMQMKSEKTNESFVDEVLRRKEEGIC